MWAVSGRAKDSRRPSSRKEQARLILLLFGGIPNSPLTCKCRAREMLAGSGRTRKITEVTARPLLVHGNSPTEFVNHVW